MSSASSVSSSGSSSRSSASSSSSSSDSSTFSGSGSGSSRSVSSGSGSGSRAAGSGDGDLEGLRDAASGVGTLAMRDLAPGASGPAAAQPYDNVPQSGSSDSASASSSDGSSSESPKSSDTEGDGSSDGGSSESSSTAAASSYVDSVLDDSLPPGLQKGKKGDGGNGFKKDNPTAEGSTDSSAGDDSVALDVSGGSGLTTSSTRSSGAGDVGGAKRSASGTIKFGAACCCVSLAVAATYIYATNMQPIVDPFFAIWSVVFVMLIGLCVTLVGCVMACCYRCSDGGDTELPGAAA